MCGKSTSVDEGEARRRSGCPKSGLLRCRCKIVASSVSPSSKQLTVNATRPDKVLTSDGGSSTPSPPSSSPWAPGIPFSGGDTSASTAAVVVGVVVVAAAVAATAGDSPPCASWTRESTCERLSGAARACLNVI